MTKARQSPPGCREMSPVHADRGGDHSTLTMTAMH